MTQADTPQGPRIAVVSAAHIHTAGFIRRLLDRPDGTTIPVLWDDNVDRGSRYAHEAGAVFEASLDVVIARQDIDAYLVCSENCRHLDLLGRLLPRGRPILTDKPLVVGLSDLAAMRRLLAAHPRTPLLVAYLHHASRPVRTVAQAVADSRLGRVLRARYRSAHHAAFAGWFNPPDIAWFTDPALAQGGAFMDMGTHAVHVLLTVLGRPTRAWAHTFNQTGVHPRVDDGGIGVLEFSSGVIASVEASWTQSGEMNGLEVVGTEASIWNTPAGYVFGRPGRVPEPLELVDDDVSVQTERLIQLVRGEVSEASWRAELGCALDAVAVVAAFYEAARTGAWTTVCY